MLKSGKVPCAYLFYASTRRRIEAFSQGKCVAMHHEWNGCSYVHVYKNHWDICDLQLVEIEKLKRIITILWDKYTLVISAIICWCGRLLNSLKTMNNFICSQFHRSAIWAETSWTFFYWSHLRSLMKLLSLDNWTGIKWPKINSHV